jgi:hypothetical protein
MTGDESRDVATDTCDDCVLCVGSPVPLPVGAPTIVAAEPTSLSSVGTEDEYTSAQPLALALASS